MGVTAKDVIGLLKQNGWKYVGATGLHYHFIKETTQNKISVPFHGNKDFGVMAKAY